MIIKIIVITMIVAIIGFAIYKLGFSKQK